jgi:hypothetical protein
VRPRPPEGATTAHPGERIFLPRGLFGPAAVDRSEQGRVFASFWRWERAGAMVLAMAGTAVVVLQHPPGASSVLERPGLFYAGMCGLLVLRGLVKWLWRRVHAGRYEVLTASELTRMQRLDASFAPLPPQALVFTGFVLALLLTFIGVDWLTGELTMHPLIGWPMLLAFGGLMVACWIAAWYRASGRSRLPVRSERPEATAWDRESHPDGSGVRQ